MTRYLVLFSLLGLLGCGDDDPAGDAGPDARPDSRNDTTPGGRAVTLHFAGRFGDQPFACGATFSGVGTSASTVTGLDYRLYVSNIRMLTSLGDEVPLALDTTNYQTADVAMLDFEDGTGACQDGNSGTNDVVTGTVPPGEYVGVRFDLGVPFALNHQDSSTAPSPLGFSSMFWGWNGGYKFLRFDGRSTGLDEGFLIHLGSTGCTGGPPMGVTSCSNPNRPTVTLGDFDPDSDLIVADLAALLAGSDVDINATGPALCMSGSGDSDCTPIFERLGIVGSSQSFFRVQSR